MENTQEQDQSRDELYTVKTGLARMLKGGVIMDVVTPEHARIAEEAGAVAVMALERVPADIRAQGGVARMSDPGLILEIMAAVTIPVMAKCRIGHFVEAQILEAHRRRLHRRKRGADAGRRRAITSTSMISKCPLSAAAATWAKRCGDRRRGGHDPHQRRGRDRGRSRSGPACADGDGRDPQGCRSMADEELMAFAKEIGAPYELIKETKEIGRLPVVNFAAGGIATPADAALMMQLGVDGVFVGSGIFKSSDPARRAKAIVEATTHFRNPQILAQVSENLGDPMLGIRVGSLPESELLAERGW